MLVRWKGLAPNSSKLRKGRATSTARPSSFHCMSTYQDRNAILLRMGFKNYSEYLYSEVWEWVRSRAIRMNGGNCYCCARPATCIHHARYTEENLSGKNLTWLMPLCSACHKHGETYKDGTKVWELEKVNERINALRANYRRPTKDRLRTDDPWESEQRRRAGLQFHNAQLRKEAKVRRKKLQKQNRAFIHSLMVNNGMPKSGVVRLGMTYPLVKDWRDKLIESGILLSAATPEQIRAAVPALLRKEGRPDQSSQ